MWSVVEFFDDNSVEVVPAYWLNKNTCAWPKKNSKKFIQKRIKPNEIEFDFLKARKMGKDRDSYTLAREKAKKAEYTSDLSTTPTKQKYNNMKPTLKTKKKDKCQQKENTVLWNPSSSESIVDDNYNTNRESNLSPMAESILVLSGTPSSPAIQLIPTRLPSQISNSSQSTVIAVKKKLNFNKTSHSPSPISTPDKTTKITDEILEGITHVIDESFIGVVNTSSSPFKVSDAFYVDTQQSASFSNEPQISAPNGILEFLQKMNRTICNIKYDINSLNEKVDKMYDTLLLEPSRFDHSSTEKNTEDIFQMELSNLPLETEDELEEFEKKLTANKEFRMKLIAELKRFSRSTLPSTVRIILRKIFTDALLEKFSYKGLKKKKVFYTLATCTVIFGENLFS
ncbi:unnamed protein product [Macrosiphum euphorbiae]|uniref:DUF4806 domain-containing protein n=1 Tax=Macrosiphum euphorbiae TaxID=13131 RepID=A0AAV0XSD3_9HEMI|nr:unnamed protein product [Macrosiphum euphorbiae]